MTGYVEVLTIVGIPVFRSVIGWAGKALEDSKITKFEVKKLVSTVFRVGLIGLMAYFGLESSGFDVDAIAAGTGAVVFDMVLSAVKKK